MLDVTEHEAGVIADSDRFSARYVAWLRAHADCSDLDHNDDDDVCAREEEAFVAFMTTPAMMPWMILKKIDAFETFLAGLVHGYRSDGLELVLLAGIKADVFSLAVGRTGQC